MDQQHLKWDKRFLRLAHVISTWSKDPRLGVGSVIVNQERQVLSIGYNGFPRDVHDCVERYKNREIKRLFVAHAEQNAMDAALTPLHNATLYNTLFPCNNCTKSIIQRRIKRVVVLRDRDWYSWYKDNYFNWQESMQMLAEANIDLNQICAQDLWL